MPWGEATFPWVHPDKPVLLRRIRLWLAVFMAGLVLSGVTAFPLVHELRLLDAWVGDSTGIGKALPGLGTWITKVHLALEENAWKHPFLAYGYDWLAFAHLVIAVAFWGPWKDPVRNIWVIHFGMIACLGIIPLAFICGPIRGIPFYWTLIDCAFAVFGIIPLWLVRRDILRLAAQDPRSAW